MSAPLLVVTGTGTGIGKTVVAVGLLSAWARRGPQVLGLKPIQTGDAGAESDLARLERASTFHVTRFPSPYLFATPVSPHLAARLEGRTIDTDVVAAWVGRIRQHVPAVVLELAGGLFSPLSDAETNADLVRALEPSWSVLVAPDRLGVLHDVIATTRAAHAEGVRLDGLILSAPSLADASTGSNAEELGRLARKLPVLASLPFGPPEMHDAPLDAGLAHLLSR